MRVSCSHANSACAVADCAHNGPHIFDRLICDGGKCSEAGGACVKCTPIAGETDTITALESVGASEPVELAERLRRIEERLERVEAKFW